MVNGESITAVMQWCVACVSCGHLYVWIWYHSRWQLHGGHRLVHWSVGQTSWTDHRWPVSADCLPTQVQTISTS